MSIAPIDVQAALCSASQTGRSTPVRASAI